MLSCTFSRVQRRRLAFFGTAPVPAARACEQACMALTLATAGLVRELAAVNTCTHAASLGACEQAACVHCTRCWLFAHSHAFSFPHSLLEEGVREWWCGCVCGCAGSGRTSGHTVSLPARTCTWLLARWTHTPSRVPLTDCLHTSCAAHSRALMLCRRVRPCSNSPLPAAPAAIGALSLRDTLAYTHAHTHQPTFSRPSVLELAAC